MWWRISSQVGPQEIPKLSPNQEWQPQQVKRSFFDYDEVQWKPGNDRGYTLLYIIIICYL